MSAEIIQARGLRRRFAAVDAVAGVYLTVAPGETIAIFGPNGAGKTTLLRLLGTLLRPSDGTLRLFGRSVTDGGAYARRRIGFLSHRSFLYPDLTPTENLEFYARAFGVAAPAARARALLEELGLLGWAHRPVRTLSRGLEQRCALARALLHRPELLLLDEPFSGLDLDAGSLLRDTLRAVCAGGTTLLMVTHEVTHALELCRSGLILVRGQVVWTGPVAGAEREAFTATYLRAVQRSGAEAA